MAAPTRRRAEPGRRRGPEKREWRSELRRAVTTRAELERSLRLSPSEVEGLETAGRRGWSLRVTPYYLALCDADDPSCPIRRQVVPTAAERRTGPGEEADPLAEARHEVASRLVRRYPDRALLLVTDCCAVHCRFCTRARQVGRGRGAASTRELAQALDYLRASPEVREVIVSGGDPLTMSTARLTALLAALRSIPQLETIRLGTRTPVCLPSRITAELVRALARFAPLWVMTHFNHPRELTAEAKAACGRLVDGGLPVMNQTVLLRGVNDDAAVLEALFRGLVRSRVRPYYLMQMDPVAGAGHLRTALGRGVELMASLQGKLSGIALPKLVVDTPGGRGKVPLGVSYVVGESPGCTRLRTPLGTEVDYIDPPVDER